MSTYSKVEQALIQIALKNRSEASRLPRLQLFALISVLLGCAAIAGAGVAQYTQAEISLDELLKSIGFATVLSGSWLGITALYKQLGVAYSTIAKLHLKTHCPNCGRELDVHGCPACSSTEQQHANSAEP